MKNVDLDPTSREFKVVLFVDMADSTAMKEKTPEVSWLNTTMWFYKVASEIIQEFGGTIVKYIGDEVMAVFNDDYAAEAINAGIKIHESIAKAVKDKMIVCNCSIGIASGDVTRIETPSNAEDFIGSVVDRAARLCNDASPKAVFVDKATISTAQMRKVCSSLGEAEGRSPEDYQGPQQKKPIRGFSAPVEYYEIYWEKQFYGVKSNAITQAVESPSNPTTQQQSKVDNHSTEWQSGIVRSWDSTKDHGFILGTNDEWFFINHRFMVDPEDLEPGQTVYFLAHEPLVEGKNRVAACLIVFGQQLPGKVVNVSDKGYAFIRVMDSDGNGQDLFTYLGDNPDSIEPGNDVAFIVSKNERGPTADRSRRDRWHEAA